MPGAPILRRHFRGFRERGARALVLAVEAGHLAHRQQRLDVVGVPCRRARRSFPCRREVVREEIRASEESRRTRLVRETRLGLGQPLGGLAHVAEIDLDFREQEVRRRDVGIFREAAREKVA